MKEYTTGELKEILGVVDDNQEVPEDDLVIGEELTEEELENFVKEN